MTTKTLPKSLHTVTVITNLARFLIELKRLPVDMAIEDALFLLGYSVEPAADPYGLAAAARKQLVAS